MNNETDFHRRSIRLKNWNYSSPAFYFITLCTQEKTRFFGSVSDGIMGLNQAGLMVHHHWMGLAARFSGIQLREFIVMPNHVHGIIQILRTESCEETSSNHNKEEPTPLKTTTPETFPLVQPSLGDIIGAFKSLTTNEYIRNVRAQNWRSFERRLWQRNYFEHIIRTPKSYGQTANYILSNPQSWIKDRYFC